MNNQPSEDQDTFDFVCNSETVDGMTDYDEATDESKDEPYALAKLSPNLSVPNRYRLCENGILLWEEKNKRWRKIAYGPIAITRIYELFGNEMIELAMYIRGKWVKDIVPKSELCNNASVAKRLSADGLFTPQALAGGIMMYLADFESINNIPVTKCVETCGWIDQHNFLPYAADDYIISDVGGNGQLIKALHACGDLGDWVAMMNSLRKNVEFRFILASSFATPLLKIVGLRPFFVYVWCTSGKGKTATLHAALSVWGDPKNLIQTFNTTSVGFERRAAFFNGIPIGLDERQTVGSDEASQKRIESIVYNFSGGVGKIRGKREGGLQGASTWGTITISTGEQPLITSSTQDGAANRTIELSEPPLDNDTKPGDVYKIADNNYGLAGAKYISAITNMDWEEINRLYDGIKNFIEGLGSVTNGNHLNSLAVVALADYLSGKIVFGDDDDNAYQDAIDMALEIGKMIEVNSRRDVNLEAVNAICAWIAANSSYFYSRDDVSRSPYLGFINDNGQEICIFQVELKKFLVQNGFNFEKTLRYMRDNDMLKADSSKYTVKRSCKDIKLPSTRVVCIKRQGLDKFNGQPNDNKTKDIAPEEKTEEKPEEKKPPVTDYSDLDMYNGDLPF